VGCDPNLRDYLTRWKCEESYRFIKQAYNLEDVRVMSYRALRNMVFWFGRFFILLVWRLGQEAEA